MREKVLIVDDIELNREILAVALGDEYEVLQASDGVQTIEILKTDSEGITAMLLDLIMPNVDGYAVLDYMREHGLLERIPVIVISAESARDVEVKCLEMGVTDFIRKPFDSVTVRRRVKNTAELFMYKNHLEDKVRLQTRELEEKNIDFTWNVNVKHNNILCDVVKIKEILMNIINNAYKYSLPGDSVAVKIDELPCDRDGYVRIRTVVSDTGIGMSEDFLEHIFEDFSREQTSTESGQFGTGLGMAIVKKIVDLMGGDIDVQSEPGKGTTFTVTLEHRISQNVEDAGSVEKRNEDYSFEGRRIILAEDNDLNAEITMTILAGAGMEVDRAADGIQCIDMLEKAEPGYYDLILMDIQMPNMDGYKATMIIRKLDDRRLADIPIIAMTANAFNEDRKKAFEVGMNGYIAKPISAEDLKMTLAGIVEE